MGMNTQQVAKIQQSLGIRFWLYISKPFQITKVLEILYALDWIWYAILSFLPEKYVAGSLFNSLRTYFTQGQINVLLCFIAILHMSGLWLNIIIIRKICLLFNAAILFFLFITFVIHEPIPSSIGYFAILTGITFFAFLRMDKTH